MVIAHNISAINTYKSMGIATNASNKSMEKLSSGYRINRAGDDAAGLSISEKMRSQIRGLNQASRNAQDGISMIQTAEGALNESHSILQRMRELAVQAATDTNAEVDRQALQNEMGQLTSEINRIGNTTEFNGMKLLDGSKSNNRLVGDVTPTLMAKGGTISSFAHGATFANSDIKLSGNGITFAAGEHDGVDFNKIQNDNGNFVKITKSVTGSETNFLVDISLTEAKAATTTGDQAGLDTITVDAEKMIKNADGSYEYNNHGISFKISAEEAAAAADTAITELKIKDGVANATGTDAANLGNRSFATSSEYSGDNASHIDVKNFTLSSNYRGRIDYDNVEVSLTTGTDATEAMTLTVTYKSGGNTVLVDTISKSSAVNGTAIADAFKYDANGIKFAVDTKSTIIANKSATLKIDLDKKLGTENAFINGTYEDNSAYFHVGANENQAINMSFGDMRAAALGIVGTGAGFVATSNVASGVENDMIERSLNISNRTDANNAIGVIDNAIQKVSEERSKYGAVQNRIEYTINNLNTTSENLQSAESRIRDVDMASEMMEMTKNNILQQASQAMLSQAMQRPQQALQLLQG